MDTFLTLLHTHTIASLPLIRAWRQAHPECTQQPPLLIDVVYPTNTSPAERTLYIWDTYGTPLPPSSPIPLFQQCRLRLLMRDNIAWEEKEDVLFFLLRPPTGPSGIWHQDNQGMLYVVFLGPLLHAFTQTLQKAPVASDKAPPIRPFEQEETYAQVLKALKKITPQEFAYFARRASHSIYESTSTVDTLPGAVTPLPTPASEEKKAASGTPSSETPTVPDESLPKEREVEVFGHVLDWKRDLPALTWASLLKLRDYPEYKIVFDQKKTDLTVKEQHERQSHFKKILDMIEADIRRRFVALMDAKAPLTDIRAGTHFYLLQRNVASEDFTPQEKETWDEFKRATPNKEAPHYYILNCLLVQVSPQTGEGAIYLTTNPGLNISVDPEELEPFLPLLQFLQHDYALKPFVWDPPVKYLGDPDLKAWFIAQSTRPNPVFTLPDTLLPPNTSTTPHS